MVKLQLQPMSGDQPATSEQRMMRLDLPFLFFLACFLPSLLFHLACILARKVQDFVYRERTFNNNFDMPVLCIVLFATTKTCSPLNYDVLRLNLNGAFGVLLFLMIAFRFNGLDLNERYLTEDCPSNAAITGKELSKAQKILTNEQGGRVLSGMS